MAPRSNRNEPKRRGRPASTVEGREAQLVALAVDLAEKQIRDGTASAQVISHYLKLGSSREFLEQQIMQKEIALRQGKIEAQASAKKVEELYQGAIDAFREYSGQQPLDYDDA